MFDDFDMQIQSDELIEMMAFFEYEKELEEERERNSEDD